jgi:hypothetical protein
LTCACFASWQYLSGPTLAIGLIGCAVGPNPEVKDESKRSAPNDGGVPSGTVEGAVISERGDPTGIIIHNGNIVAEWRERVV